MEKVAHDRAKYSPAAGVLPVRVTGAGLSALGLIVSMLGGAALRADDRLTVASRAVGEGTSGQTVDVLCEHDDRLLGYTVLLRYDPEAIRVDAIVTDGTDVVTPFAREVVHDPSSGEIAAGVILDVSPPLDSALPVGGSHRILRLVFDPLAPAGSESSIEFVPQRAGATPRVVLRNELEVQTADGQLATRLVESLQAGSLRVTTRDLVVDAGEDRVVAESSAATLEGSASRPDGESPLAFHWRQVSGPPAQQLSGQSTSRLSVVAPPVDGDRTMRFELGVNDGNGEVTDLVEVAVVDLDLRSASVSTSPTTSPRFVKDGTSVLALEGEVAWQGAVEEGVWEAFAVHAAGAENAMARLASARLVIDTNGNGEADESDETLAVVDDLQAALPRLDLALSRRLTDGERLPYLLEVGLVSEDPSPTGDLARAQLLLPLLYATLAIGALSVLLRQGERVRRTQAVVSLTAIAGITLAVSCKSGGGGGSSPPSAAATPAAETVRFELVADGGIAVRGADTGVPIPISGLPASGPEFQVLRR